MKIQVQLGDIAQATADVVVVNLFEGITQPAGGTGAVDAALGGVISQELTQSSNFKGKLGETWVFPTYGKIPARYVVLVGLGKADKLKSRELRRASAAAIRACQRLKAKTVATLLHGAGIGGVCPETASRLLAEGAILGDYRFTRRKSPPTTPDADPLGSPIETLLVVETDSTKQTQIEAGIKTGVIIAESTCFTRDLVMDTPNYIHPTHLAQVAESLAGGTITCKVLEKSDMEAHNMGLLLSVSQGSDTPPKLLHLTYTPSGPIRKKVTIVGKGITFDSGGLSLKPSSGMESMKTDMSGAAAILGTIRALSLLGNLDIQVDAIAPCCENMPNGRATRPGDVVTAMNGKTVEINNTDAEGRLVLADALTYAQKAVDPDEMIDLATLTGACIVALGKEASGLMGTDKGLLDGIQAAGDVAGERYWPLPLFDEFKDMLKSDVADYINAGSKGQAGSSAGGTFLKEFVDENRKWAHLDIAGPSFTDKDVPEVPKGGSGVGVRSLLYYLYGWTEV